MPEETNAEPTTLFHYTDLQGLIGILQDSCLWATCIGYLNDASEFSGAYDLVLDALAVQKREVEARQGERDRHVAAMLNMLIADLKLQRSPTGQSIFGPTRVRYVASLSEHDDQLSQWRAYGNGGGFAIGFKIETLRSIAHAQGFHLVRCSYDQGGHKRRAEEIASDVRRRVERDYRAIGYVFDSSNRSESEHKITEYLFPIRRDLANEMQSVAPVWKHEKFHEEAEWRIVSTWEALPPYEIADPYKGPGEIRFRRGPSAPVPYATVRFRPDDLKADNLKDLIDFVRVGPCPNPDLTIAGVEHLLAAHLHLRWRGRADPGARRSEIPYRTW